MRYQNSRIYPSMICMHHIRSLLINLRISTWESIHGKRIIIKFQTKKIANKLKILTENRGNSF